MHFISCINNHGKHAYIKQVQRFLLAEYRLWSLNHKKGSLISFLASRLVNCLPSRLREKSYPISSPVNCRFSRKILLQDNHNSLSGSPKGMTTTLSGSPKGMTEKPEIRIFSGIRRPEGGDSSSKYNTEVLQQIPEIRRNLK
ncbi:hypothetical protein QL285_003365 [Trifolium repens]|nr:hypothetical protein QL285_003365 [Trifolium repens]